MSRQKLNEDAINSTHDYISEFMGQEGGEIMVSEIIDSFNLSREDSIDCLQHYAVKNNNDCMQLYFLATAFETTSEDDTVCKKLITKVFKANQPIDGDFTIFSLKNFDSDTLDCLLKVKNPKNVQKSPSHVKSPTKDKPTSSPVKPPPETKAVVTSKAKSAAKKSSKMQPSISSFFVKKPPPPE